MNIIKSTVISIPKITSLEKNAVTQYYMYTFTLHIYMYMT